MPQQKPLVVAGADAAPEAPVLMLSGLGPVTARRMTIASAHFEEKRIQFMHSGRREFVLPAAPRGELTYLHVYDSMQPVAAWPDFNAPAEMIPQVVAVETIIDDMERSWGRIVTSSEGSLRVGIGRIAGDIATEAEKKKLIGIEESLCRAVVADADRIHHTGKGLIEKFHRQCLDWLGSEKRDWYQEIQFGRMKTGALTGQRIPMEALADGGQNLLEFYVRLGLNPMDFGDDHVANMLKDAGLKARLQKLVGVS